MDQQQQQQQQPDLSQPPPSLSALQPNSPGDPNDDANKKKSGRRKIKVEFIEDKSRRQITFSKRKAGLMKKAYELTTLTGTQALLLVASETGHVYTFATPKLQPFVTLPEGKNLIQACLNAPDNVATQNMSHPALGSQNDLYGDEDKQHLKPDSSGYNMNYPNDASSEPWPVGVNIGSAAAAAAAQQAQNSGPGSHHNV